MSSSSSRKLSSKEKEILLRQRAISLQRQQQQQQQLQRQPPPPPPPPARPPPSSSSSCNDLKSKRAKTKSSSSSSSSSLSQLLGIKTVSKQPKKEPLLQHRMILETRKNDNGTDHNDDAAKLSKKSCRTWSSRPSNAPPPRPPPPPPPSLPLPDTKASIVQTTVKRPTKRNVTLSTATTTTTSSSSSSLQKMDQRPIGKRPRVEWTMTNAENVGTFSNPASMMMPIKIGSSGSGGGSGGSVGGGGKLSSLLCQAGITKSEMSLPVASTTTATATTTTSSSYPGVASFFTNQDADGTVLDMDDYYDNLRQWDFLKDFNDSQQQPPQPSSSPQQQQQQPSSATDSIQCGSIIPNVFRNGRHYQKIWAPLCLQETRAQYLADVKGKLGEVKGRGLGDSRSWVVRVQPMDRDVGVNLDAMTLVMSSAFSSSSSSGGGGGERGSGGGNVFVVGDLICLTRKKNVLRLASEGRLYSSSSGNGNKREKTHRELDRKDGCKVDLYGIMGHVEYSRKSVDGLKVRISRQQWMKFCTGVKLEELYLWNLGGNVTSAREFAALCRLNTFSMLPYILCRKMTKAKDSLDLLSDSICGEVTAAGVGMMDEESLQKDDYLKKLGGNAALGEGFVNRVKQKFNVSQLGAISSAACEYGQGGFTLIKGPPGTGKSTTLVAILNALHIRQFNRYYQAVHDIVDVKNHQTSGATKLALADAAKKKPRLLVCAPSNNAIDNVIQKIMENGFMDGSGLRYNPSIVRIGVGQGDAVKDVSLESKVNKILQELEDPGKVETTMAGYKSELQRIQGHIHQLRKRMIAVLGACDYPLATEWEIRCDESCKVHFVNHMERRSTFECPPPPKPGESSRVARSQPEYKRFTSRLVKLVDRFASISSTLEQYNLTKKPGESHRIQLETHILDTTHIVFTTLGTAGCLALESAAKFEVVVVDEAAQSVEPSTLVALQLGSSHAVLVGDPQQLPATIFNVSGRTTKYDRSMFQRLEEAGHEVHLLDTQYRMHPQISKFPRHIFYGGYLKDGPNVCDESYGNPLCQRLRRTFPCFQPLTVFNLDSSEQRGGSSVSNMTEAKFALQLYQQLAKELGLFFTASKVSIITPYAQQASLIRRLFSQVLGATYDKTVEINTVDSFQGREADIVILSCVRAAGSKGIGFLSDVRRMNVALTRSKHFLFVISRCRSICVNPYWDQLVKDARKDGAVVFVPHRFVNSEDSHLSQLKIEENEDISNKKVRKVDRNPT